ncbi:MAG TPA: cysteine desulfurase family protein [Frankiaceae bacterium]|nr:cysteine desulfurase family protein [Frankiaceae bacterium]
MQPGASYLDWASQAPLHPAAREALLAAYDAGWADPTRLHREGRQARLLYDAAREAVASALGVSAPEVSFTSSGTAAAHLAVLGGLTGNRRRGREYVLTPIEHSCVLHAAAAHEASGGVLTRLPVEESGRVVLSDLEPGPATALVSVQSANQEIGTRQPIAEVAERCRAAGVPLHVDAAQSVGREPVSVRDWGCQLLTASAHKFGGPSGVGLLVIREGTRWERPGPDDDRGDARVSGPLDVPGAVATAAALVARRGEIDAENVRLAAFAEQIREAAGAVPDAQVHGDPDPAGRLPHLVSMSFLYVDGEALLDRLAAHGVAAASGSACTASSLSPSHVLEAIGALTHGNLRVSLGRSSSQEDVDRLLNVLPDAVAALRAEAGAQGL